MSKLLQTITIKTFSIDLTVTAEIIGVWGIHAAPDAPRKFQVTHIPTGYAFLGANGTSKPRCRQLIAEVNASGLDWSFTNPKRMSRAIKELGKALCAKYTDAKP